MQVRCPEMAQSADWALNITKLVNNIFFFKVKVHHNADHVVALCTVTVYGL